MSHLAVLLPCFFLSLADPRHLGAPDGAYPRVAGLPFFMFTAQGFFISFFERHFAQYPCAISSVRCFPPQQAGGETGCSGYEVHRFDRRRGLRDQMPPAPFSRMSTSRT
jgi:hypothetical protein